MVGGRIFAGAVLGLLCAASCVSEHSGEDEAAAFPDPLILSQSRCSGTPPTPVAPPQAAANFEFAAPYPLPDAVTDHFHEPISTGSAQAQTWFDTGLAHMANFNHDEAIAAFRAAQSADPDCAMCFWGEGLAFGSNINAPYSPARGEPARVAADRALELAETATAREAALIAALDTRYRRLDAGSVTEDAAAYAVAMDAVARAYPRDTLILSLAAEANMDTQPWDYWQAGARRPKGHTARTLELLETALAIDPDYAPAIHLYIHTTEASVDPFRAEAYADRLRAQSLGVGHLVHMPSHIYFRLGNWKKALDANIEAIAADERYIAGSDNAAAYGQVYYPHNVHFVVSSSQMAGDGRTALAMADKLSQVLVMDPSRPAPFSEYMAAATHFAAQQFASHETVLALPEPPEAHLFMRMSWHYARGAAFAARGNVESAGEEAAALAALAELPDVASYDGGGVPLSATLAVAIPALEARVHAAGGDLDAAIRLMDEASDLQAAIPYNEPAWWYYPVRQTLAAYLLMDGQFDRAEREFYRTLIDNPNNAYALYGLAETYAVKGDEAGEEHARHLFAKAWMGPAGETPDLTDL